MYEIVLSNPKFFGQDGLKIMLEHGDDYLTMAYLAQYRVPPTDLLHILADHDNELKHHPPLVPRFKELINELRHIEPS